MKHLRKYLISKALTILMLVGLTASYYGQTCATKLGSEILEGVSEASDRITIEQQYMIFMQYYCEGDFPSVHKLLAKSYLNGLRKNSSKEFSENKRSRYSGNKNHFISFIPNEISEAGDETPDIWIIRGCLVELLDGERKKVKANLFVWREENRILFSDISPEIVSMSGATQKCG